MDAGLKRDLEQKVRGGTRLTREDGIALYESDDLAWLGGLAHEVRIRANGDAAFFTVGRHLNLTGTCTAPCAPCSVRGDQAGHEPQVMPAPEAVRLATGAAPDGLAELHITGGLHPTEPWSSYPRVLRALNEALPQVRLKAFAAAEIRHFEKISGQPATDLLDELIDAGLESLTGGAEIFDEDLRGRLGGHGSSWEDFARIHRLAHGKGLTTPCGMLYGHGEEPRHRVDHVLRLRELQDGTGGFHAFVPLLSRYPAEDPEGGAPAGRPDGAVRSRLKTRSTMATGADALKTFAVSRLLFDNVAHITAFWGTHGVRTAQLALLHGADDMDGSVGGHQIAHGADGSGTPDELTREDVADLIRDAGFRPVERDGRHEVVRVYEGADPGRRDVPQPMRV